MLQAAKRMVQSMSKGLYSMTTVVQGEKLGQFLDTDFPSMDNLQVINTSYDVYYALCWTCSWCVTVVGKYHVFVSACKYRQ